jgi:hypothetical protein
MGLARAHAIALVGVQGHPVEIEADIENGMVALLLVGLPDTALREARDRIRSAIVNTARPGRLAGSRSDCRRPAGPSAAAGSILVSLWPFWPRLARSSRPPSKGWS